MSSKVQQWFVANPRTSAVLGLLVIAILAVVQFLPTLKAPLAFDAIFMPPYARRFESWTDIFGTDVFNLYRPVKNAFYYLVEASGGNLTLYHSLTISAFLLAMTGVFALAKQLTGSVAAGLATAAIFTFSASNTTVATWTSCMNISIAVAAMTTGLVAWDKWREDQTRIGQAILFVILTILGLLSYETAIALLPLVAAVDLYRGRSIFKKASILRYAGVVVLIAAWLLVRHQAEAASGGGFNPSVPPDTEKWQLTASAPYFLWTHFLMWAAPWGRLECLGSYIWNQSIPAIILPFCWFLLIGGAALCVRCWKAGNLIIFGLAWFFIASFPSGNFVPLGNTPYADYYTTIPSVGLSLALVAILRSLIRAFRTQPKGTPAFNAALICFCILIGWRLAVIPAQREWVIAWSRPVEVMARSAAARPYQYLAKSAVAEILAKTNYLDTARWYAESAKEDAAWLSTPHLVLGDICLREGNPEEAIEHLRVSQTSHHVTDHSIIKTNLLMAQAIGLDSTRADEAFQYYLPVLKRPDSMQHIEAILSAAAMFGRAERPDDEKAVLERGLELHPDHPQILQALSTLEVESTESSTSSP